MDFRRIHQVIKFGKKHAKEIASLETVSLNWISIFYDILLCYCKYGMWSNQYMKEKFWEKTTDERKSIGSLYKAENDYRNDWVKKHFEEFRFAHKWMDFKWETSAEKQQKRVNAYIKRYNIGKGFHIGPNVMISCSHYSDGELLIGNQCKVSRGVELDYTGGLKIGNGVELTDGVIVFTHGHNYVGKIHKGDFLPNSNRAFKTPLVIEDNVLIGTNSIIMPGVSFIGENSVISAGSVVTKKVPANTIVAGNPAKVLGSIEGLRTYYKYKKEETGVKQL